MKKIVVLTEDDYTELKKAILDALWDFQHTQTNHISEFLQQALDILDRKEGEKHEQNI